MPKVTWNHYRFFTQIVAQDSREFFNYRTKFNSVKLEHMIFEIPEFHNSTKEVPLDFDIPQSLDSL